MCFLDISRLNHAYADVKCKHRPMSNFTADIQFATHQPDKTAADGQAKSCSFLGLFSRFRLYEGFKEGV